MNFQMGVCDRLALPSPVSMLKVLLKATIFTQLSQTQHIPDGAFAISFTDPNGNDLEGGGDYDQNYLNTCRSSCRCKRDLFIKIKVNENTMISPLLLYGNGLDTEKFLKMRKPSNTLYPNMMAAVMKYLVQEK